MDSLQLGGKDLVVLNWGSQYGSDSAQLYQQTLLALRQQLQARRAPFFDVQLHRMAAVPPQMVWLESTPEHFHDSQDGSFNVNTRASAGAGLGHLVPGGSSDLVETQGGALGKDQLGLRYGMLDGLLQARSPCNRFDIEALEPQRWRNRLVRPIAEELGIIRMRTFDLLAPLWDSHAEGPQHDCTQYCLGPYSPMYYLLLMLQDLLPQAIRYSNHTEHI